MAKVAFITSILGGYESICRPFAQQTVDTDFICFTDNPNIESNGWIVDTNPYHDTHPSPLDNGLSFRICLKVAIILVLILGNT